MRNRAEGFLDRLVGFRNLFLFLWKKKSKLDFSWRVQSVAVKDSGRKGKRRLKNSKRNHFTKIQAFFNVGRQEFESLNFRGRFKTEKKKAMAFLEEIVWMLNLQ